MPKTDVLWDTTTQLCKLLEDIVATEAGALVTHEMPHQQIGSEGSGINVHLYAVTPDSNFRHQQRLPRHEQAPILPLRLRYFVSSFGPETSARQRLLGKALGCLYGRDYLFDEAPFPERERTSITLVQEDIEVMNEVWGMPMKPRPLGMIYEIGPVFLESEED